MSLNTKRDSGHLPTNLSVRDIIVYLGEGNIGALSMLTGLVANVAHGDELQIIDRLLCLCDAGVTGTHLWFLYKYVCDADTDKFVCVIDAFRNRTITRLELHAALDIDGDYEKRIAAQQALKLKVFSA